MPDLNLLFPLKDEETAYANAYIYDDEFGLLHLFGDDDEC